MAINSLGTASLTKGTQFMYSSNVTGTTGSPTTGTSSSGGVNYSWWKWTGNGSITFNTAGYVDVLVIGGGGGGGANGNTGCGGAGGGYLEATFYFNSGAATVTVGAGGAGASGDGVYNYASPGNDSSITNTNGYCVAFRGGGASPYAPAVGGSSCAGQQNYAPQGTIGSGAQGGGAGASSGTGKSSSINGTATTYSAGKNATTGGAGSANTGDGGQGGTTGYSGGSGVVFVRVRT